MGLNRKNFIVNLQTKIGSVFENVDAKNDDKENDKRKILHNFRTNLTRKKSLKVILQRKNSSHSSVIYSNPKLLNKLKFLKQKAQNAAKVGTIFTISRDFAHMKQALLDRGWIEKIPNLNPSAVTMKDFNNESEILSLLIVQKPANFEFMQIDEVNCVKKISLNKLRVGLAKNFAIKGELYQCDQEKNAITIEGISDFNCPMSFSIKSEKDLKEFVQNYRILMGCNLVFFLDGFDELKFGKGQIDCVEVSANLIEFMCTFVFDKIKETKEGVSTNTTTETKPLRPTKEEQENQKWSEILKIYKDIVENEKNFRIILSENQNQQTFKEKVSLLVELSGSTLPRVDA